MEKLNVVTVVGTRPEIIKLSEVIKSLDQHFNHTLIHTGQNYDYELNGIFFDQMNIRKPDIFLECAAPTPAETIANTIEKSDRFFRNNKVDALLIYGDTNSCLCVIAAKRLKIPIFHMEAGNRCFDQRVPEEINRKIVDHLSDINMVHSEHARKYLEKEGIPPQYIILTGSPMLEVLNSQENSIIKSCALENYKLTKGSYFIVSLHREENIDNFKNLEKLVKCLNQITIDFKKQVILSLHPRTKNRLEKFPELQFNRNIIIQAPLSFADYITLQKNSHCALSDSGTITEESSLLKFPAIMVRETHERPEGMDVGSVIMSGLEYNSISNSINIATQESEKRLDIRNYNNPHVSSQVVKIIRSYTNHINQFVWKK